MTTKFSMDTAATGKPKARTKGEKSKNDLERRRDPYCAFRNDTDLRLAYSSGREHPVRHDEHAIQRS